MKFLAFGFAAALMLPAAPAQACRQLPIVYFHGGSAAINEDGRAALAGFANEARFRLDRIERISVVGHSDRTGPSRARHRISLRRAQAVRDVLVAEGVPAGLIAVVAAADSEPAIDGEDNVREPQNRRVELRIETAEAPRTAAQAGSSPRSPGEAWAAVCG